MTNNKKNLDAETKKTVTRRSILDWMGKSVVLGLGSELLLGCDYSDTESDGALRDGGADSDAGIFFEPGDAFHKVYDDFVEYTADPQDLVSIIETWKLSVTGMVEKPVVLNFGDLLDLDRLNPVVDFHCVTGWSVFDVPWDGIHLSSLFDIAKPTAQATYVTFHTINDVYNESLPLDEALEPNTLLAFGIGGSTLPLAHGFPLRLVVPRKFGYKNAKYVYELELTDAPLDGYWEQRGYTYEADVPEGILRPGKY